MNQKLSSVLLLVAMSAVIGVTQPLPNLHVAVPGALPHALSRPRSLRSRERSGRP